MEDRFGIICLCGAFNAEEDLRPLTTAEFRNLSVLLRRYGKRPGSLFHMSPGELLSMGIREDVVKRIRRLLHRVPVVETILGSYKSMGIHVLTLADPSYFPTLKFTLGGNCPPVLCCAGNLELANRPVVGVVGSRAISPTEGEYIRTVVDKILPQGYGVVSGGADGTDSIGEEEALRQGGFVVEFPAVPLFRRMRNEGFTRYLEEGRLLLATPAAPSTGFSTNLAATRNRMIYAHSAATVVIRATACKGGTWSGATDALKRNLCPLLCWDQPYEGNQALIRNGALPIEESWDGKIPFDGKKPLPSEEPQKEIPEQCFLY